MADTSYTSVKSGTVSDYAAPYVGEMLGKSRAFAETPYTPYGGQRTAELSDLQNKYLQGLGSLEAFKPAQFGTQSWTDPGVQQKFMSPYQQGVTDIALREAQRQADIAGTRRGAQAVNAGAFGGYRQGIENAEAERNTAQLLNDIQTRGLQSAYGAGMGQFNTEGQQNLYRDIYQNQANLQGYNTGIGALKEQLAGGNLQQAQAQRGLDIDYGSFKEQRDYPMAMLNFQRNMLTGLPLTTTTDTANYQPNPFATGVGTAMQAAGLIDKFYPTDTGKPTGQTTSPTSTYDSGIYSLPMSDTSSLSFGNSSGGSSFGGGGYFTAPAKPYTYPGQD